MIEDYITSFVDGRVRLRHPALINSKNIEQLRAAVLNVPGMHAVTVNGQTGSVLLEYDPGQLSREELLVLGRKLEAYIEAGGGARGLLKTLFTK